MDFIINANLIHFEQHWATDVPFKTSGHISAHLSHMIYILMYIVKILVLRLANHWNDRKHEHHLQKWNLYIISNFVKLHTKPCPAHVLRQSQVQVQAGQRMDQEKPWEVGLGALWMKTQPVFKWLRLTLGELKICHVQLTYALKIYVFWLH